ncbi:hypothetical protein K3392_12685 [Escherichia coli]|nr:hypothetical protein K3392_12685 [Escherichia coli]
MAKAMEIKVGNPLRKLVLIKLAAGAAPRTYHSFEPVNEPDVGGSADADPQVSHRAKNKIDWQRVLDSYHEILPEMPSVKILTDTRKKICGRSGRNSVLTSSDGSPICDTLLRTVAGCWKIVPMAAVGSGSVKTWIT